MTKLKKIKNKLTDHRAYFSLSLTRYTIFC